jgi:DNA-binding transcriptional regulator LsrR (DeoR family)
MGRKIEIEYANDPVRWAAWLYHGEGRTQNEVAECLGVSRQTAANYLAEARARGLVSVHLAPDLLSAHAQAEGIVARYRLEGVHLLPESDTPERARQSVATGGGKVVSALMQDGWTLGVSAGRTLSALAARMPSVKFPQSTVIQIAGSSIMGAATSPEVCTSNIASALGAHCINLHAPAYVGTPELTRMLLEERAIARHFEMIAASNIIVFGIGELTGDTNVDQPPYLDARVRDDYLARGARAVVFGRFLNANGAEQDGPLGDRTMAISLETARAIPVRVAVVSGRTKHAAVRAALAAGLVTHLVVDAGLATLLLSDPRGESEQ